MSAAHLPGLFRDRAAHSESLLVVADSFERSRHRSRAAAYREAAALVEHALKPREVVTMAAMDALPRLAVLVDGEGEAWQQTEPGWWSPAARYEPSAASSWALLHGAALAPLRVVYAPEPS